MIKISNLKYSFSSTLNLTFPDWEVSKGNHGLIIGSSGCGKTTLLHLMSGLLAPQSGSILFEETDIGNLSQSQLDKFRGQNIGLVFQKPHLIASLTVRDNIALSAYLGKVNIDSGQIAQVLDSLGLEGLADRKISEISQGQAQRVSIARAIINKPKVIFGDEPTASLDDDSCGKVIDLLKEQTENFGATLILATHDHRVKSHFSNQLKL